MRKMYSLIKKNEPTSSMEECSVKNVYTEMGWTPLTLLLNWCEMLTRANLRTKHTQHY